MGSTEMPVEVAVAQDTGEVTITFGPMPAGDVKTLLEYVRTSETFEQQMLDVVADTSTRQWDFGIDDAHG